MVSGSRAGPATDDPVEHGSGVVGVHRVTCSAPFGEELLAMDGIWRGISQEARKILALCRIRRAKKRIAERDRIDVKVVRILRIGRIDEEDNGHSDLLVWIEAVFVEPEAMNFIEIEAARPGGEVERCCGGERLVAEILGG